MGDLGKMVSANIDGPEIVRPSGAAQGYPVFTGGKFVYPGRSRSGDLFLVRTDEMEGEAFGTASKLHATRPFGEIDRGSWGRRQERSCMPAAHPQQKMLVSP